MTRLTPLSVLKAASSSYPLEPAFKIPLMAEADPDSVEEWESITYAQFEADVELHSKYWAKKLSDDEIPPRSVVALWLGGLAYSDVLSIYGMLRAGFIPELFSLRLPEPDIIYELMHKADAKALIYDRSIKVDLCKCPVPLHEATPDSFDEVADDAAPAMPTGTDDETVMIFHTSGSTSGSPKLVRCSYRWFDCIVRKAFFTSKPRTVGKRDVTVWLGSMCHIGQNFMLLGSMQHGACTIQPTKIAFTPEDLTDMITRCGLNRLNQFATFLSTQLRSSRRDPKLLHLLQGLDEILYSGLALPQEDEKWALDHGLRLTNLFGNTECGAMLLTVVSEESGRRLLRPIPGTNYGFFPISSSESNGDVYENANSQLLELVILSESGDCPDPSLRAPDGHYHTGDLFIQAEPGMYVSRGRDDDWIKSQNSLRCDTRAIEDNVRSACATLIEECIVVGNGRPSPALFVEPKTEMPAEELKKTIIRRTRAFHARRYMHERITSTEFVFVVPKGTLPRTATKGNVRRKAVEEQFKLELDAVFGMSF